MSKAKYRKTGSSGPATVDPIRFRIPDRVDIIGQPWTVKIVPQWSEAAVGECDPQKRLIRIRQGIDPTLTVEVFIHELLHASLMSLGIEHEEQLVNSLAPVLLDTFRRGRFVF